MDWSELASWQEYSKLFVGLFAMTPPAVFIPVFLGLVADKPRHSQVFVANVACLALLIVLTIFVFIGEPLLDLFGITVSAFRAAGGLLLIITALAMMRGSIGGPADQGEGQSLVALAVVPLAIPILAGPGAISTTIIFSTLEQGLAHRIVLSIAVVGAVAAVYILMRIAIMLGHLFTDAMGVAFMSVMGLIVAAIGVEFIFDGIAGHFPDLRIVD